MATIKLLPTVVGPGSGAFNAASPFVAFSDAAISWPTVEANTGLLGSAYSKFDYVDVNGNTAPCVVKKTVAQIYSLYGVSST